MTFTNYFIFFVSFTLFPLQSFTFDGEPHHTTAFIGFPGEIEILSGYSHFSTQNFWNNHGKKLPAYNKFKKESYFLYSEYAINFCNSLFVNEEYCFVCETLNGQSHSFQDLEIGWKHSIYQNSWSALTTQILGVIPTGSQKSSIRYAQPGGQLSIMYSQVFSAFKNCGWLDLDLGYRFYKGFPSDQILASLAIGYNILPILQLIAMVNIDYGISNGKVKYKANYISHNPNYRLLTTQVECIARAFKHVAFTVGFFQHIWGRNIGTGKGFFGGAWIDF